MCGLKLEVALEGFGPGNLEGTLEHWLERDGVGFLIQSECTLHLPRQLQL